MKIRSLLALLSVLPLLGQCTTVGEHPGDAVPDTSGQGVSDGQQPAACDNDGNTPDSTADTRA